MKIAIIGAGNNAQGHANSLAAINDVTIVGIADPQKERAQAMANEVNAQAYVDHQTMLNQAKPDAVWICSPCWLHADQTVDCAQAGAHIMCEKPMALSLEDCDKMIAAAKENNVKLMIDQSTRYAPSLLELKRRFEAGDFGDLVNSWSIRQSYHQVQPGSEWRLEGDKSGGIVFEWEVHEIDFVCSIGGDVTQVYAHAAHSRSEAPTFLDHFSAILTFRNGGYANLEASQSCTVGQSGRGLVGSKGSAQTQGRDTLRIRTLEMERPETVEVPTDTGAASGLGRLTPNTEFINAIMNDTPSPVPGEDARKNIEIGLAIIQSGQTGEVVKLPL
ncbi:MAG: Gfo/Idh/MocA family oxidoreductase [Candidatus Latescibacteria bacterium]|nr:Gfo/Idh/MocA family oxidoreductase [Candidatus Latescibacterota bacterium]